MSSDRASIGDRDMMRKVLEVLWGNLVFDKVDIKPGTPNHLVLTNVYHLHTLITTKIDSSCRIKKKKWRYLGFFDQYFFYPLTNQSPNQVTSLHLENSLLIANPEIEFFEANENIEIILLKR